MQAASVAAGKSSATTDVAPTQDEAAALGLNPAGAVCRTEK